MKIVWIGAGNLATQLGEALHRAGHETLQVPYDGFCRSFGRTFGMSGNG